MGLSAGQYSMQCWSSTSNPAQLNQPKLLFQCLQLIKALQHRFTNGEIAVPSNDSTTDPNDLEICILYRVGVPLFGDIANFLTETANSLGLDYRNFVKQDAGITRYFNQDEADNVSHLGQPVPDNLDEQTIADNINKTAQFNGFHTNDSWKNNIQADQLAQPFQIPRATLQRLHSKEGEDLAAEIRAILSAIQAANAETKSSTSVITMIAKGAVWLFNVAGVASGLAGSVWMVMLLYSTGFVAAAVATGAVLLTIVSIFTFGAYLTLKDATNVLLVVNDTPNDLLPRMEWIENGERRVVPQMIPAAVPNSDFVPCGLFVYSKYQISSFTLGTYGSAFGVSFDSGHGNFSIGMDCPNSLMGGNNSIEVHNQEHAQRACQMALDSGCTHGWCHQPHVDVKIADHWGNINWGRAVVLQD